MNGKKKLISKVTALLLALLLTNHFVFQAYAAGETEVVVTESAAESVAETEEAAEEVQEAASEAEIPAADKAEETAEMPEEVVAAIIPTVLAPAAEEAATESDLESLGAAEAAAAETAEEIPAAEDTAEETAAEDTAEETAEEASGEETAEEAAAEEIPAAEETAEEQVQAAPAPAAVGDAASAWAEISSAFTVDNIIAAGITDANFAQAVYDSVTTAAAAGSYEAASFKWASDLPMPLMLEEIAEGSYEDDVALTRAILENYAGDIDARNCGITDIAGWQLLKSAGSIDVTRNKIEDISDFLQDNAPIWQGDIRGIHAAWHFEYNPIWKYPAAGSSYPTIRFGQDVYSFSPTLIAGGKLSYLFGEEVNPTLNLGVMMGSEYVNNWMFNFWTTATAAGTATPETDPALAAGQTFASSMIRLLGITEAGTLAFNVTTPAVNSLEGYQGTDPYTHTYSLIPTLTLERYGLLYVDIETETLGGFHFKKVSANDDSIPVEGATYTLYFDEDCTKEVGSYVTDENGEFYVSGLAPQTYYLKETATPDGYELNEEVKTITIAEVETTTGVEGGVPSITLDARTNASDLTEYGDIALTNDWATNKTYSGIMLKNIPETAGITASMIDGDARAIITNKGTTGYKKIDSISASAAGENYDTDVTVVVKTGLMPDAAAEIGTYTNLADATAAINAYTDARSLNGNIYVSISDTYTQKVDAYETVQGNDETTPVSLLIPVEKTVKGGDGTFTFQLCNTEGAALDEVTVETKEGKGTAEFKELVFEGPNPFNTEDGTYTYIVKEVPGNETNVTYDTTEYTYVVAVKEGEHENENGETVQGLYLEVTKNGAPAEDLTAAFTNIRMLPVAVQLEVKKTLENAKLLDGEFTFLLEEQGANSAGASVDASSDADGKVTFEAITYTTPGTYNYTLKEIDPQNERITADGKTFNVTVVVALDPNGTDGASVATVYVDGQKAGTAASDGTFEPAPVLIETGAEFTNTVSLPTYDFEAEKTKDDGKAVEAGEFTFALTADDYTGLTYVKNGEEKPLTADLISEIPTDAQGMVDFDSVFECIVFPAAEKTYTFTLTENDVAADSLYIKDSAVFEIEVPVVLNESNGFYEIGEVVITKGGEEADAAAFLNVHKRAPLTITKKVAQGGDTTKKFAFEVRFDAPVDDLVLAPGADPIMDGMNKVGFRFSLADGESMKISNLPVGIGYTVTETAQDGEYFATEPVSGTVREETDEIKNEAEFNNIIKRGPVAITKTIENVTDYMDAGNDEFTFEITVTPGTGATIDGFSYAIDNEEAVKVDGLSATVSIKAGQVIQIADLPYGTTVTAKETNTEALHYTAEEAEKSGVVTAETSENGLTFEFVNVKDKVAPIAVQPEVIKTVDGGAPETVVMLVDGVKTEVPFDQAFTFALGRVSAPEGSGQLSNATQTVKNDAAGKVPFGEISGIDMPGVYRFEIFEMTAEDSYMSFDDQHYYYDVTVGYDKDTNTLVIEKEEYINKESGNAAETAVFENKTIAPAPVEIKLEALKTVNGTAPVMTGTYSFVLTNTSVPEGAEKLEARTAFDAAGGKVDFGSVTYDIPGTYVYEIREIAGDVENVIYDARVWTVTVVVADDGTSTNTLGADVTYAVTGENPSVGDENGKDPHFANYTKVPVEIPVLKNIEGNLIYGIPTFSFTIEAEDGAPLPENATLSLTADDFKDNAAETVFDSISFEAAGTYKYTISETAESKDGWTYDAEPVNVTVTVAFEEGKLVAETTYEKAGEPAEVPAFVNEFTPVPVKFSKQDLGGEELPGATIQVFDKDGNLIDEWVSSDTPHEISGLVPGEYVMHEVAAPEGYTVTTDIPFTVDEEGLVEGGREVDMTDGPTKVEISKQNLGGEELPGAMITIYDSEGNVATTEFGETCEWVSGDTPKTIEGLPVGSYTLHEVVAPDGYTVTTDINFTISEDGTVTVTDENGNEIDVDTLVLTDAPTVVNISKQDLGGKELPGASMVIYDEDGNVATTVLGEVCEWVSGDTPKIIEGLPAGRYVLHEVVAPEGYTVATDIEFVVESDGTVKLVGVNGETVAEDNTVVMVDGPAPVPSIGTPTPSVSTPTPSASTPTPSTATGTPRTGDPSNTLLWVMTALDSAGIFAVGTMIGRKRRRDDDEENEE